MAWESASLGIEFFALDDGWFGHRDDDGSSRRDWQANEAKLPGGLKALSAQLKELGMEFGLWIEPEILLEGCAGGGGRFDAGMLYYTPQIWCSDDTDAIDRLSIHYGTSFACPPCTMGAHVSVAPNHQNGRVTPRLSVAIYVVRVPTTDSHRRKISGFTCGELHLCLQRILRREKETRAEGRTGTAETEGTGDCVSTKGRPALSGPPFLRPIFQSM